MRFQVTVCFLLACITQAQAHRLDEVGIGRQATIRIEADKIGLEYAVGFAQIMAFPERRAIDADGDGALSDAEVSTYLKTMEDKLRSGLFIEIDGTRPELWPVDREAKLNADQLGPIPFEINFGFEVDLIQLMGVEHELVFRDDNYVGYPGWMEPIVEASDPATISESFRPWAQRDTYDTWASSREERTLRVLFTTTDVEATWASSSDGGTSPAIAGIAEPERGRSSGIKKQLEDILQRPRLNVRFVLFALLIAGFLGAAHALQPGHGKTVVAAYLIGSRGTVWNAVFLGLIVTLTHTSSIILLGLLTLFASQYILPQQLFPWLGFLSGIFILGVGIWLFIRALNRSAGHSHSHGPLGHTHTHPHPDEAHEHLPHDRAESSHIHEQAHTHPHENHVHEQAHTHPHEDHDHLHVPDRDASPEQGVSWGSLLSLGISGGLVPCPGALVILLSAIALNRIVFGLSLIVAFSVGLAAVLITIGVLIVVARSFMDRFTGEGKIIQRLPLVSAVVIIVLGIMLAVQSLISGGILTINL